MDVNHLVQYITFEDDSVVQQKEQELAVRSLYQYVKWYANAPSAALCELFLRYAAHIGNIQTLSIGCGAPNVASFTSIINAISNNAVRINKLHLCILSVLHIPELHCQFLDALTNNHTVMELVVNVFTKNIPMLWKHLCRMLRTRKAPLRLSLEGLEMDDMQHGMDPETGQPALLHWKCVQQSVLAMYTWPIAWTAIQHCSLQQFELLSNYQLQSDETKTMLEHVCTFLQHNSIRRLYVDGAFVKQLTQGLIHNNQPLPSVRGLSLGEAFVSNADLLDLYPNLHVMESIMSHEQMYLLAKHSDRMPVLEAIHADGWSTPMGELLVARPSITYMCISFETTPLEYDQTLVNCITCSNLRILETGKGDCHINLLTTLVRHPNCSLRMLLVGHVTSENMKMLMHAVCANTSLRALLLMHVWYYQLQNVMYELVQHAPQLMMMQLPHPSASPTIQATQDILKQRQVCFSVLGVCCCASLFVVGNKPPQKQAWMQRDAWQQLAMLKPWYTVLQHHPLCTSILAWQSLLRRLVGGGQTPIVELPHDSTNDYAKRMIQQCWYWQNERDCTDSYTNASLLIDSLYVRELPSSVVYT